jgi:hypothetical protein
MRILILSLCFVFVSVNSQSWTQNYFYKLYSGNGFDRGEDVIETSDSSFVISGSSGSWGENAQAFMMKIDSMGNYLWSHSYGGDESEEAVSVMQRPGIGFYLAGMTNSTSQGNFDAMLIKTDEDGNQEWMKTYPNPAWDRINDAMMTKDTGIVMVGYRQPTIGAASDMLIMRLTKEGDTVWTKTIGTVGEDRANALVEFQDSLYYLVGDMFVPDSNLVKGVLIKFNDQGVILSQEMIGSAHGNYQLSDIENGEDRIFIVGSREVTPSNHDQFFRILDGNGVFQNEHNVSDDPTSTIIEDRRYTQVVFLPDPYYKVSISLQYENLTQSSFSKDLNIGFFEVSNGNWLAGQPSTTIMNQGVDHCSQMFTTHDGGFIAVGYNSVVGDGQNTVNGGGNIFALKVFPNQFQALETDTVFTLNQLVETIELEQTMVELTLYPNPTSSDLQVNMSEQVSGAYTVCDLMGKRMLTGILESNFTIETSSWNQGVYFLNIGQHSFKFIKQ